jgi:hypothetical protein
LTYIGKQELQETLLELQKNILKVAVTDWSDTRGFLPITIEDPAERAEMCLQMAVLKKLFGRAGYAKLELEAYLWSRQTQEKLQRLGWLEGGIVVLDKQRSTVRLPHVDRPTEALRLPMIRPYRQAAGGLRSKMTPECFQSTWNAARATVFPETPASQEPDIESLGVQVYDRTAACPAEGILEDISKSADQFAKNLFGPNAPLLHSGRTAEVVIEHLSAIVENYYLRNLRLGSSQVDSHDFSQRAEFLRFFGSESGAKSILEQTTGTLFVPDGEVSLLLIEYLFSSNTAEIGGRAIDRGCDPEIWEVLGFQDIGRITRMGRFVRDLLALRGFDHAEHDRYKPILDGQAWQWLRELGAEPEHRARIQADVEELIARPAISVLARFCEGLQRNRGGRLQSEIQQGSPISLPIHLYLRHDENTNRALLAFPLTGWNLDIKSAIFRNLVVYYVGTFRPGATDLLSDQIEYLRSFISIACWPTVTRLVERDDETMQRTANVFGHDLKNRLAEIRYAKTLSLLQKHSTEPAKTDRPAMTLRAHLDMIYGTMELFRSITKISAGSLPSEWMDEEWKNKWPPDPFPPTYIEAVESACETVIRYVGQCYAQSVEGKAEVLLRRIDPSGGTELNSERLEDIYVANPEVSFPPFKAEDSAGPQAVLAGLTELARNAAKVVTKTEEIRDLLNRYGELHIDYAISHLGTRVIVELWNPKWRARLLASSSIQSLSWMYSQMRAVRIEPVVAKMHRAVPYAYSRFSFDAALLKFKSRGLDV